MDQDPSTSNWRSLEDALRAPEEPDVVGIHEEIALADSFPRFHSLRNLDLREAVEEFAEMIEKGEFLLSFGSPRMGLLNGF
jgi:ubiquitin carboxyl-terminal hydrolase 34